MSIKKVNTKVDFIKSEHDVLDFWKKNSIFEKRCEQILKDTFTTEGMINSRSFE